MNVNKRVPYHTNTTYPCHHSTCMYVRKPQLLSPHGTVISDPSILIMIDAGMLDSIGEGAVLIYPVLSKLLRTTRLVVQESQFSLYYCSSTSLVLELSPLHPRSPQPITATRPDCLEPPLFSPTSARQLLSSIDNDACDVVPLDVLAAQLVCVRLKV